MLNGMTVTRIFSDDGRYLVTGPSILSSTGNEKIKIMRKPYHMLPLALAATALLMTGCRTHGMDHVTEVAPSDYTDPPIPTFIQKLLKSAEWCADTICVADGKAFYRAFDERNRTTVIYSENGILLENPTLCYDSLSSDEKYKFNIFMADKRMTVDFRNTESLKEMARLDTLPASFCRFRKDSFAGVDNRSMYSLCVDFMRPDEPHAETVNTWLAKLAEEYTSYDDINGVKHTTYPQNPVANEEDKTTLARRAAYRYFSKLQYESDVDMIDEAGTYYRDVCLRAWHVTRKYVTVLKYTNEYMNGVHGYFTEELASYCPETRREIDWDYLFKPECRQQVLDVFLHTARTSTKDAKWDGTTPYEYIAQAFMPYDDDGNPLGKMQMPRPGLGEKGVVFSFQPYHLGGFADGVFHFSVPYKELKPYLTDEAKSLLEIGD